MIFQKEASRIKVVHLLYSGLGGHGAVLFSLIEGGFMRDFDHYVFFIGVEAPLKQYISRCESLGIKWSYEPKKPGRKRLEFIVLVFRELKSLKAGVLFLHGLAALPSIILLKIFTRRSERPFVLVRETQANHLKSSVEWALLASAHFFANNIVHLTSEAASGARQHLKWFYNEKKVAVISNGLDTDYFKPSKEKKKYSVVFKIGMQSRLQANKDHTTLIEAFFLVCQKMPEVRFELGIAGDGSTRSSINEKIRQLGLHDRVEMYGMLGQAELQQFLNGLDIYVHCTHGETMSTAIMQALASGLPIIASDVAGVNNMIPSSAGILYQPGNQCDLAEQICSLVDDSVRAINMGLSAREFAIANYGINITIYAYEKLATLREG